MIEGLSNDQQRTYDSVFQHPITSNLERREVRSLFEALGKVTDEHNGNIKIDRNGRSLTLHPAHGQHPAEFAEVMRIRHFLESSELGQSAVAEKLNLLVVVEPRKALVFRSEQPGTIPQAIVPEPHREVHHGYRAQERDGQESRPLDDQFYDAIATEIQEADEILLFGTGSQGRETMDGLLAELKTHHYDLFNRVVGCVVVGGHHISEEDLLAKAQAFYQNAADRLADSEA